MARVAECGDVGLSMWEGEGWKKTRRQLGVGVFLLCLALEASLHVGIPVTIYSITAGLLGLDALNELLDRIRTAEDSRGGRSTRRQEKGA